MRRRLAAAGATLALCLSAPALAADGPATPSDQRCLNLSLNYGYATLRMPKVSGMVYYYLGRLEVADPGRDWIGEDYDFLVSPAGMGDLFNAQWKADFKACTARLTANLDRLNDGELKMIPPAASPEVQEKAPPVP